jgi:hypothetical protein
MIMKNKIESSRIKEGLSAPPKDKSQINNVCEPKLACDFLC